jgi:maltooligosyltrehalose synthase
MDAGGPFGKGGWAESELILPEPRRHGRARDVFTGRTLRITARRRVRLDEVFGVFPIALLEFERE